MLSLYFGNCIEVWDIFSINLDKYSNDVIL
jgi:hypothetical protein